MVDRLSALEGHYQTGEFGVDTDHRIRIRLERNLFMSQVAWWSAQDDANRIIADALHIEALPAPGRSTACGEGQLLRTEPMKCWLVGDLAPELNPEIAAILDLSHSRTRLDIAGEQVRPLLNRLLPLDLRNRSMPVGSVASSAIHHVGVTIWHVSDSQSDTYALFLPRGFAVSVWEVLLETAMQFGVEVI